MARYSAGARSGAGSTTLPIASLYAAASVGGRIREIGVFNTTTTAVALKLVRLTTAGTSSALGATIIGEWDQAIQVAASCTPRDTHSSTGPTVGDELGFRTVLGAAAGAGVIWTFGDTGILVPAGTANGVGLIVATGTGQVCDWYVVWDE